MDSHQEGLAPPPYSPPLIVRRDITLVTVETFTTGGRHLPPKKIAHSMLLNFMDSDADDDDLAQFRATPAMLIRRLASHKWRDHVFSALLTCGPVYPSVYAALDLDIEVHLPGNQVMEMLPSDEGFQAAVATWMLTDPTSSVMRITAAFKQSFTRNRNGVLQLTHY